MNEVYEILLQIAPLMSLMALIANIVLACIKALAHYRRKRQTWVGGCDLCGRTVPSLVSREYDGWSTTGRGWLCLACQPSSPNYLT